MSWLKNCGGLDSPEASVLTLDDYDQILSSLDVGAQVTVEDKIEVNGSFTRAITAHFLLRI